MKQSTTDIIAGIIEDKPELKRNKEEIESAVLEILKCYREGGKLLICGNGGSAADSEHIVGELMKGFLLRRPVPEEIHREIARQARDAEVEEEFLRLEKGLPAISLVTQTALQTAIMNDIGADMVFAQQVMGYGREGDILIGISTSGESSNVVNAACVAKALKMKVIAMTGRHRGRLARASNVLIDVPASETWKVQEYHLPVYHGICAAIENEIFGDDFYEGDRAEAGN